MNNEKNTIWPDPFLPTSGLYLVATPIGNLRDMTLRAIDVLSASDIILCEDTRVSVKLLKAYGIEKPLKAYHDHSSDKDRADILKLLKDNKTVSLISDAGMPMIADPGYKLVRAAKQAGIAITSIPGANAALMGLQLSALPTDRFSFQGFMPAKAGERQTLLQSLKTHKETLLFYETAPRLLKALQDIEAIMGARICVVARELTKKFEEVQEGEPSQLIAYYESHPLKGEIVLIIAGQGDNEDINIDAMLINLLAGNSVKDAVEIAQSQSGLPKKEVYKRALALKDKTKD